MTQENTLAHFLKAVQENESLIKGFASRKCKDCLGRGVLELAPPGEPRQKYVCACVLKNAKKEFTEIQ